MCIVFFRFIARSVKHTLAEWIKSKTASPIMDNTQVFTEFMKMCFQAECGTIQVSFSYLLHAQENQDKNTVLYSYCFTPYGTSNKTPYY